MVFFPKKIFPSNLLIYGAHGVVDEVRGQQDTKWKYLHITASTSLCGAQALSVNENAMIISGQLHRLSPNPKTLGAWIHAWADLKTILQTQQPIEKEGLSSSVKASNAHHCQPSRNLIQDCHSILLQMALAILRGPSAMDDRSWQSSILRPLWLPIKITPSWSTGTVRPHLPCRPSRAPHQFELTEVVHCSKSLTRP